MHMSSVKLFRATDFSSFMAPAFFLCKLFGAHPYKRTGSGLRMSKIGNMYNLLMFGLVLIIIPLQCYDANIDYYHDSLPSKLQSNCYLIFTLFILVFIYFFRFSRLKVLRSLEKISETVPEQSFRRMSMYIHAKDICCFLFMAGQIFMSKRNTLIRTIERSFSVYEVVLVYLLDSMYLNCVLVIYFCFKMLNRRLKTIKTKIVLENRHLLRRVYHEQNNDMILAELNDIQELYKKISDFVQKFNSTFGLQMLASFTLSFIEITFSLYFYLLYKAGIKNINLEKQIWYNYFTISIFYYSLKIFAIVCVCQCVKDEANQTVIVLHEASMKITNENIKEEVQNF